MRKYIKRIFTAIPAAILLACLIPLGASAAEQERAAILPGDLNYDGIVNTTDVVLLRRYIAGGYGVELTPPPSCAHETVTDAAVAPTCTESGLTEGSHCGICGEVTRKQESVAALGHAWGQWTVEKEAQMEVCGTEARVCTSCGRKEERSIPALQEAYPSILHGHLQALPDGVYAHTNIWTLLKPKKEYFYAGTHWAPYNGDLVSVTIPITSGDQIYASSFEKGIRVTFFGADGVPVSLLHTEVKAEFEKKGFITAPENAIAVNIPMWDNSASNVLQILTLDRMECQKHIFTQQPTVVEPGLVSKGSVIQACDNCGYVEKTEVPELMSAGEYTHQNEGASIVLPYRIYYPTTYESNALTQYPVVIFYHGASSRGEDNRAQVLNKAIVSSLVQSDNCIVLAPQCAADHQWVNTPWGNGSYDSVSIERSVYLDASVALLNEVISDEQADADRVYAIGLSMGGYAAWNVMMEYPEKFAAVVPICGAADPNRASEVLGTAVWAFHGDADATVPVSGSREMIEAIRALGGIDVKYSEYKGVGHSSWVNAAEEPELMEWLFSKVRHEHTYQNGLCTACGTAHPNLSNYSGKVISILGDSISTFAGYIPVADGFNLDHRTRYPQDNLLTDVNETWWMQVIEALDAQLGINDSWASTEVYNYIDAEVNSTSDGTKACMASVTRIRNLGSNGTPDVILFFGGTNDITQSRPIGIFDPNTAPTQADLTSVKWETVAEAYVDAIMRMRYYYPDTQIVALLPYDRSSQGNAKVERYNTLYAAVCEHYGVPYVDLRYCGISMANIPDGTHPDADGMDRITASVIDLLISDCDIVAGEHTVHSVTHDLNGAESSLSQLQGNFSRKSLCGNCHR